MFFRQQEELMPTKASALPASIYQLKVTLHGSKPPIWRRLQVPSNTSLAKLHDVLQITMGWTNSHLHQFIVFNQAYSDPSFESKAGSFPAACGVRMDSRLRSLA
jgi:hypothetical protein